MRKTVTYWLCVASVLLFSAFAGKMAALPADDAWQSVFPGSGETCQLAENDVPGEPGQPERNTAFSSEEICRSVFAKFVKYIPSPVIL